LDFKISGGDLSKTGALIIEELDFLEYIPVLNSDPTFQSINMITRFVVKGAAVAMDEKDALYTLSLTVE